MGPYRARDLAQYVVDRRKGQRDSLTPLQLMKIVYLCHGWFLGVHGRPLVKDEFQAWQYGPVARDLYDAIRHYRSSPVDVVPKGVAPALEAEERDIVDQVVDHYAKYDGIRLSALTHQAGSPWDVAWAAAAGKNSPISNDLIEHHYSQLQSATPA